MAGDGESADTGSVEAAVAAPRRLAALARTGLLDSAPEESFDRFTRLASRLLSAPVALVSLVDRRRQFFKSQTGLTAATAELRETALTDSLCRHVVASGAPLVVRDAAGDARVRDEVAVRSRGVQAYAGVPVRTRDGEVIGSFCVVDRTPREWSPQDLSTLQDLGEAVSTEVQLREALLESDRAQRLLRLTVDAAHLGTWHWDPRHRLLSGDTRFTRQLGAGSRARTAPLTSWLEAVHPDDRPRLADALGGSDPVDTEVRAHADGAWRWLELRGQALRDRAATPGVVSGVCLDTTVARDGAAHVARALEHMSDGFYALDGQWRFTYLNHEAQRMLGRSADDLLGRVIWEEFPGSVGSAFEHEYRRAVREHRAVSFEEYYAPLHGWFNVRAYPTPDGLAVYALDVTERRTLAEEQVETAARQAREAERERQVASLSKALEELRQATGREGALAQLASSAAFAQDLPETLQRAASVLVEVTDMTGCAIVLDEEHPESATVSGASGLTPTHVTAVEAALRARVDAGEVAASRTRGPVALTTAEQAESTGAGPSATGTVAQAVAVPLIARDRPMGVLYAAYPAGQELGSRLSFVEAIADQVAVAVDNARLLLQAQEKVALEERQRLSRDLHDSLSQTLFSIALVARAAELGFSRSGGEERSSVGRSLAQLRELTQAALAETRSLILELRPALLAEEGLVTALERRAAALSGREGLQVQVRGPAERLPVAEDSVEHLYRIAQEALHNAVRHARASTVQVCVALDDAGRRCSVEVADDGTGFDPDAAGSGGLGLRSMQERIKAAGGELQVLSRPGSGTTVRASVPCSDP